MELAKYSKAIAAILAAVVLGLVKNYTDLDQEVSAAVEVVIGAIVAGAIVYAAPRNKD